MKPITRTSKSSRKLIKQCSKKRRSSLKPKSSQYKAKRKQKSEPLRRPRRRAQNFKKSTCIKLALSNEKSESCSRNMTKWI